MSFFGCTRLHSDIDANAWSSCRASGYVTTELVFRCVWLYSFTLWYLGKDMEWMPCLQLCDNGTILHGSFRLHSEIFAYRWSRLRAYSNVKTEHVVCPWVYSVTV